MTPKKYPQNLHTPPPQIFFPEKKTPKIIEIQNFEPQKMTQASVCMKKIRVPPPPTPPGTKEN